MRNFLILGGVKWQKALKKPPIQVVSYHPFQGWWSFFSLRWSNSPTNYLRNPRISKKSMCANKFGCVPNKLGRAFRLRKRPLTEKFVMTLFT